MNQPGFEPGSPEPKVTTITIELQCIECNMMLLKNNTLQDDKKDEKDCYSLFSVDGALLLLETIFQKIRVAH